MSSIVVAGDTSGTITIAAPAVAGSGTLTLPVATDTLVGKATTDTLTNKTLTSPVLTTPALGTPASGVLTNCTGVVSGALPAGSVLQVVNATYATQVSNATNTTADTGLTATITPTKNTSKILVTVNQSGVYADGSNNSGVQINLFRGATNICKMAGRAGGDKAGGVNMSIGSVSTSLLDAPATTSATIYKTQFLAESNVSSAYVQVYGSVSTITLMEIAG